MKLLLENWREYLAEEQLLHEHIEKEFSFLSESLTEWQNKGLLEEGIAQELVNKVRAFSQWKNDKIVSWISPALEKLHHLSIKLRRAGKLPYAMGKQLRNLISDLMKPDNLVLAASIISIIAGLLMGDIVANAGTITDLLNAVDTAPSLVAAVNHMADASDIKDAIEAGVKSAQLATNVRGA